MTKRYPFRGLLRRRYSRDPRHFQRIPFRVFQPPDRLHHPRLHLHKASCRRRSCRHRFFRHVHHPHFPFLSVMRQLRHPCAPKLCPSSVARKRPRRSRFFRGPTAPPENNSPSTAPRYLPSLATSMPSLPPPPRTTPPAPARNASARSFPSLLPPTEPPAKAMHAPPLHSTNQSPVLQTIRTSPSSKPDSPATQTPASLYTFRTLPVS